MQLKAKIVLEKILLLSIYLIFRTRTLSKTLKKISDHTNVIISIFFTPTYVPANITLRPYFSQNSTFKKPTCKDSSRTRNLDHISWPHTKLRYSNRKAPVERPFFFGRRACFTCRLNLVCDNGNGVRELYLFCWLLWVKRRCM